MDRTGPYWDWAWKVAARRGGGRGILVAGAVIRVYEALEDLERALPATQFLEIPPPLLGGAVTVPETLEETLHDRLERLEGSVLAANALLEEEDVAYKERDDVDVDAPVLVWTGTPSGPGRLVVTIAACQVWQRYWNQAESGHELYRGADLRSPNLAHMNVSRWDPTVVARVQSTLERRFPADLVSTRRIESAIRNHGDDYGDDEDEDTGPPELRSLPRRI